MANALGRHLLVELYGCNRDRLNDADYLKEHGVAASQAMGATVVAAHAHRFQPVGVSLVVVLAESHLAIHTWPERAMASVDIFVCNPAIDPYLARRYLADCLAASDSAEMEIRRGELSQDRSASWTTGVYESFSSAIRDGNAPCR